MSKSEKSDHQSQTISDDQSDRTVLNYKVNDLESSSPVDEEKALAQENPAVDTL